MKALATGLLALTLSFGTTQVAVPESRSTELAPANTLLVEFDASDGESLEDLLRLGGMVLGLPVAYDADEVRGVRVRMAGKLQVQRDDFRGFLDDLLRREGFVSWDAAEGEPRLLTVARLDDGPHARRVAGQLLDVARLDERPARITGTYSAVFPLEHLDARAVMVSLVPHIERHGAIRHVGESNQLVITSPSLGTLRELRDLLASMDVAPRGDRAPHAASGPAPDLAALAERVAALERLHAD